MNVINVCFSFLLIALLSMLVSCSVKQRNKLVEFEYVDPALYQKGIITSTLYTDSVINIDVNTTIQNDEILNFSTIIDSMYYVKLDNAADAIIGEVSKIIYTNGLIYVLDANKTKRLKLFTEKGEYLTTIGSTGNGPGEYTEPTDFCVYNQQIIVYDQYTCKLLYYDINGLFKNEKRMPFIFRSFIRFDDNKYVFHGLEPDNYHLSEILDYSILQTDSNFHVKQRAIYRPKNKYIPFTRRFNTFYSGQSFYYQDPLTSNIWQIKDNGTLKLVYTFNYENKTLPQEMKLVDKSPGDWEKSSFCIPGYSIMSEDYLFYAYSINSCVRNVLYSNKTMNQYGGAIRADDVTGITLGFRLLTSVGNTLIGYQNADQLCDKLKNAIYVNKSRDNSIWIKLSQEIKLDDNPVLIFYKLKDDL